MTFRFFKNDVRRLVEQAIGDAKYQKVDFDLPEPPQKEFGDLSCNAAFLLAKHAKKPPPKIAIELAEAIKPNIRDTYVLSVEPAGGHVNLKAD